MGISRMAAMMIQGNEVECSSHGPYENDKYGGGIWLIKNGSRHTPILTVDYGYYESREDAERKLKELVDEIREMNIFAE